MSTIHFKASMARSCSLILLLVSLCSSAAFAGRDYYDVYLNSKLIKRQFMGEAMNGLMDLQLDKTNINDKLTIYYFHCNVQGAGKGRNIIVKNTDNQVIKEWKFADATGSDGAMIIEVKEILALQKSYPLTTLNFYYYSTAELPAGLMLAAVKPSGKTALGE